MVFRQNQVNRYSKPLPLNS